MKPQDGWIKVYRSLLKSPIFSSEKGLKVWVWCLLKATHAHHKQYVGRVLVPLSPGQFVFGRQSAAQELRMNESTVRDWISVLRGDRYIDVKSFNKYSVISIINWQDYQENDSEYDNKPKTKRQQKDTNKNVKNEKNVRIIAAAEKNLKKDYLPSFVDEFKKVVATKHAI